MRKTDAWGIDDKYEDGLERWHEVSVDTKRALVRAMGGENGVEPEEPRLQIVKEGARIPLAAGLEIELEDGTRWNEVPSQLPLGYHRIRNLDSGEETRLIVAPEACYLRQAVRLWGWTLQLYALRSRQSWGMGDLEDLRTLCAWSADILNAGVIMTNPLGAAAPGPRQQPSPYFPSSRLFRNPLYLRVEEVPGAREALGDLEQYAARGQALNKARLIDRNAIYALKMEALERIWSRAREHIGFDDYERKQGRNLEMFAVFCALAERFGANWHEWPRGYQDVDAAEVARFTAESGDRIRFHKWLQWLMDRQLLRASERRMIMQDLPIGVDPGGADAWFWQGVFTKDVSVGAPPDPFSETGQNWGLPPFIPNKLRAAGYEPFAQTLRSTMCHSAGLRIDHVMGLFRLFWIPRGESSQNGTYVRYNADEMLAVLALESVRARAFVVGEDLGTVEPGVREKLARFGVLSYRVLWFEENVPAQYPYLSLASVSTHDLPTIAGVWSGADFEEQKQCGMKASAEGAEKQHRQLEKIAGVEEPASVAEVIVKTHEALATAPSAIILASLDDVLEVAQRPNLPGVSDDKRPNWSIPLPKKLEEIETDARVLRIAGILRAGIMDAQTADETGKTAPSRHRFDDLRDD